jgi:anthranilate phosphoribosyltransferase
MHDLTAILAILQSRRSLTREQMKEVIGYLLTGQAELADTKQLLAALAAKGETVEELTGAAEALRQSMLRVPVSRRPVVDTCGTGGDGSQTFNISTAAALALAATGVSVAKHGNRKITSRTGSADVLAALGIHLETPPEMAARCLQDIGICFCFAPFFHPAMKHVGEARRQLGHPTIFNRLGPLANPALADCQLLGVGAEDLQRPMAETLQRLGTTHSLVVRGEDGVDEISLSAPTRVLEVTPAEIREHRWSPADFGVQASHRDSLFADDPESSAACIRDVFEGHTGPRRDVVLINAAAGLWLTQPGKSLRECADEVAHAIDSGHARRVVTQLGELTRASASPS